MAEQEIFELDINKCPNCGSDQFCITVPEPYMPRPSHWQKGVLGLGNCRNCKQDFLVKLPYRLRNTVRNLLQAYGLNAEMVLGVLFPQ